MVIFIDIDGVLIPGRAYFMAGQTKPLVTRFDPCVVGMVNSLCSELGAKLVIHSNWRRTDPRRVERGYPPLHEHFVNEGILREHLHSDPLCPLTQGSRWVDILAWLAEHPEEPKREFWVLEDEPVPADWRWPERVVTTDFDEGLTFSQYLRILNPEKPEGGLFLLPGT